jgi:phosphatidylglycerol:prolipoprotein diacylglycerol transferase
MPRHPSQLYEFALEGVALLVLLWWFSSKQRPRGAVSGLFLLGYGVFRFGVEYTREPDSYLGLLALGFSMGQWLSLPMIALGIGLLVWAYRSARPRAG